jgi:hypothetical protein
VYSDLLTWRRYRYLKLGAALLSVSVLIFMFQGVEYGQPANGGTWPGYILGTLGAVMIVWLSMLGIRKRSYRSRTGTVQGWTSAHVYIGTALLIVGTLHSAAQMGWNIHTLAWALMVIVILSGFVGTYAYLHLPQRMITNRENRSRDSWLQELSDVDDAIRSNSQRCDADLQVQLVSALDATRLGGSFWRHLRGIDSSVLQPAVGQVANNQDQGFLLSLLSQRVPNARERREAELLNDLLGLVARRRVILAVLRRDARSDLWLKLWLVVHVPTTIALLLALTLHIVSVFLYW